MNRLAALKAASARRRASVCSRCGRSVPLLVLQAESRWCETCWTSLVDSPVAVRLPLEAQAPLLEEPLRPRPPFNAPRVDAALVPLFEEEAKERMLAGRRTPGANLHEGGRAAEKAAEAVNVSPARVSRRNLATVTRQLAEPGQDRGRPGAARLGQFRKVKQHATG